MKYIGLNIRLFSVLFALLLFSATAYPQNERARTDLERSFRKFDLVRSRVNESTGINGIEKRLSLFAAGRKVELVVVPNDMRSPNYRAEDEGPTGGRQLRQKAVNTYKGRVLGEENTDVRVTMDAGRVSGYFVTLGERFFVEPANRYSKSARPDDSVVYKAEDSLNAESFWCESDLPTRIEYGKEFVTQRGIESPVTLRRIDLATEADYEYVNTLGGATQANNEILSILNMVEGTYTTQLNLTIRVVFQHTWSTPDSFGSTNASGVLAKFKDHWNANFPTSSVPRTAAHLFTAKSYAQSLGVAYLGVYCSNPSFSYGLSGYISWAPGKYLVPAHEMGHNLGASHVDATQNCASTIMNATLTGSTPMTFCSYSKSEVLGFVLVHGGCMAQTTSRQFDFDGDGLADVSVFRPSNGRWYVSRSSGGFSEVAWGQPGDKAVSGDYDGDGKSDSTIYRGGEWWRLRSSDFTFDTVVYGYPTDIPVPADFDGDGKTDIAVYRPSSGHWFWMHANGSGGIVHFGIEGDIPLPADFDGDGRADLNVFRPSDGTWHRRNSSNGAYIVRAFGITGDKPVIADFDGDRKSDLAVWRPSDGRWYMFKSADSSYRVVHFGVNGDIPAPGDFDGDGKTDISVYRPSEGMWYRINSLNGAFIMRHYGITGDDPVPSYYVQ